MPFKIKNICFIGSASFFPSISIEKLGEILDKSNAYHYVKEFMDTRYHSLLKRKLTFPYEWLDNIPYLTAPVFLVPQPYFNKIAILLCIMWFDIMNVKV
jgi:hypothetical protein